ncbi:hypothetical protein HANVADRAFT_86159 [Hanseniaspora valbyensis NRRL Y-1626]|uniref:Uncharacterized protein n=1 Tax=Hanseniaspora valbyensis NRRL Y-1626 TaxID=766949 RepID=A0A1B7TC53_9ASCO|nr:hypothetical protein HANVADRAFT_86159 [Hanseniaspora valbyensis NRRL Y-1626]
MTQNHLQLQNKLNSHHFHYTIHFSSALVLDPHMHLLFSCHFVHHKILHLFL